MRAAPLIPPPDSAPESRPRDPTRILLFTDTLADVNGVSRFVRAIAAEALAGGRSLHVVTSTALPCPAAPNLHNVPPLHARPMPAYPALQLAIPSPTRIARLADALRPHAVHVSTPGPVGLLGRRYALRRGLPLLATHHTDFPAYLDHLLDDRALTWLSRRALAWFYRPADRILTRSRASAAPLRSLSLPPDRIEPLAPGIDTDAFHPHHRDPSIWSAHAVPSADARLLYCGRVSVEKGLPLLTRLWPRLRRAARTFGIHAQLIVVGDGPYRAEMQRTLAPHDAHFTGYQHGRALAALYASSDLFLFPSTTDTLGQVVMEAQASGLPAIVTDRGGPSEIVRHVHTGIVVPCDPARGLEHRWLAACLELLLDEPRRRRMADAARHTLAPMTFRASFEHFWSVHEAELARRRGPLA